MSYTSVHRMMILRDQVAYQSAHSSCTSNSTGVHNSMSTHRMHIAHRDVLISRSLLTIFYRSRNLPGAVHLHLLGAQVELGRLR